ncbi:MAG: AI-2E family transporter [Gemmatimonadota bacterium]|nr:AI-2E family transporter [Gemmatimonadota bacterium]MDH5758778.1 AI-2E family transporter [Gemmatimonadota bacterium]
MIFDRMEQNPGARLLFILACLVVVVHGLKLAQPVLLPAALALFLAVLSLPIMLALRRRGVPAVLAIAVTVLVDVAVFGLVILLAIQSVSEFESQLTRYVAALQTLQIRWLAVVEERTGIALGGYVATELLDARKLVDLAGSAVGQVAQFLSNTFLVLLIMIFMLAEATVFPEKFRIVVGDGVDDGGDRLTNIVQEIQSYLGIKTVISLATGVILGAWAYVTGLDFPVLLGIIAFGLNYVPTVGSIIAAAPALVLSVLIHGSLTHALLVGSGYVVVNTMFGNILEPNLMGRRLGLSTLVVVLSLLFWGWAWGPLGALLSVPLTVVVKIWLEHTQDLRWIAILLDKTPPAREPDPVP